MADIRAAAKALHDSRQALPEHLRTRWTGAVSGEVWTDRDDWVCDTIPPVPPSTATERETANVAAKHIARCASPDVTEALANLLDELGRSNFDRAAMLGRAADALAAAILREDR